MSQFSEKPLPEYIEKKEEKESLRWVGFDSSLDIFPHLNLDWKQIEKTFRESKKPIGDLGSSFSPLPVEGELRGIDILSVDLMHEYNRDRYEMHMDKIFRPKSKQDFFDKSRPSKEEVEKAIKKVVEGRLIVADIAHLPLEDRSLSIVILHDTLPKHSPDLQTFLEKQLPEILRVTDQAAYIYPMSMYKTTLWKSWKRSEDIETNFEDIWVKASEMTPEDKTEEELARQMTAEDDEPLKKSTLEESHALYKDPESIKQISEAAGRLGFEFRLEKGTDNASARQEQEDAKLGVFTRIKQ